MIGEDLTDRQLDRIIEMAWEDRTPFDAIKKQFGLNEDALKKLMQKNMKSSSYRLWRKRVYGPDDRRVFRAQDDERANHRD